MAKKKKPNIGALKERFKKETSNQNNSGNYSGEMYPFWIMKDEEKAVVRILPDANEDNENLFFVDKLNHNLVLNGEKKTVACPSMYGKDCPICELSRKFYKEEGKTSQDGKFYYRKKTSMLRVLVTDDPLPPDENTQETRVGKVLNTQFGWQLMEKIKHSIMNDFDDDDSYPWDMDDGINFAIGKTKSGEYSKYDLASGFERKNTSVEDLIKDFDDIDSVDDIELIDLSTLLPQTKDYDELANMLEAHINGTDYDDGNSNSNSNSNSKSNDEEEDDKKSKKSKKSKKKDKKKKKKKGKKSKKEDLDESEGDDEGDDKESKNNESEDDDDEDIDEILNGIKRKKDKKK